MNWSQSEVDAVYARRKAEVEGYVKLLPAEKPKRGMNKWEAQYAEHLEMRRLAGEIKWWAFEWMRLRLADGAWFKPDFAIKAWTHGDLYQVPGAPLLARAVAAELEFHEVKGMWREAAKVRIKVAADRFPFNFYAVTKDKRGEWVYEQF